ncbi:hypothetical protein [Sphingomonas sp.]|uniref:EF-hand domain-containing protein n=1 Tax=Sphingomonas sp. TaxID=28214 RepID=UPI00286C71E8|nr:hypothetical protein [Sphingomonas sp.]
MTKFLIGTAAMAMAGAAFAQGMQPPTVETPAMNMPQQDGGGNRVQTRAEVVAKAQKHFAKMDSNRDGFIAADEMQAMGGQNHGRDARKERRQQAAFEWLDRNRDNMISRSEYDSFRQPRGQSMGGRGTAPTVMPGDRPAGGYRMGGGGMGAHMLKMADANNDGRISLQELTAASLQRFDRADADHNGQVTPDERKAMHGQMKLQRGRTL